MHSPGSRWDFRQHTVACFGFCACIPQVRIVAFSNTKISFISPALSSVLYEVQNLVLLEVNFFKKI